jgi:streptogramin lyase
MCTRTEEGSRGRKEGSRGRKEGSRGRKEGSRGRKTIAPALLTVVACFAALLGVPAVAAAATTSATELLPISGVPVIKQFPTTAGTDPVAITAGPDGNIWYTEVSSPAGDDWEVGRMTFTAQNAGPEGSVTNFSKGITSAGPAPHGDLFDIAGGPDGDLWFTGLFGEVGRITTAGVATVQSSGVTGRDVQGITPGPNGTLWFAEGDKIGRITPQGTTKPFSVKEFSRGITPHSLPLDITEGPDHNLWFTEFNSGKIGRITPQGVVTEFQVAASGLLSIATGPDGNLWVTDVNDRDIYRIQPSKCSASLHGCNDVLAVSTVGIPGLSGTPGSIVSGPNGNLWFTIGGSLAQITTRGQISPASQGLTDPTAGDSSQSITTAPEGTLWFSEPTAGELGQVRFCSTVLCGAVIKLGPVSGELLGSLRSASKIGILVQRDDHGRLVGVGRVPLGYHSEGPFAVAWNLEVEGHRLSAGRYVITLRALDHLDDVVDKTRAVTVTVR